LLPKLMNGSFIFTRSETSFLYIENLPALAAAFHRLNRLFPGLADRKGL